LAARRADAHADARNSSYGEALNLNNSLKSANDSRFGNKYNMLATRATGSQPGFMPDGTNDSLRSALQARQNTNAQAMGVAGSLVGDAPKLDNSFAKPNYSNAIALGGLADLISTYKTFDSGGDGFQSGSRNSQLMKQAGTSIRDRSRAAVPTF
jgi:hypothetical protein